jgi:hypothetical protein
MYKTFELVFVSVAVSIVVFISTERNIQYLAQLLYKSLLAVPTSCFNNVPHIGIHIISYPRSMADK